MLGSSMSQREKLEIQCRINAEIQRKIREMERKTKIQAEKNQMEDSVHSKKSQETPSCVENPQRTMSEMKLKKKTKGPFEGDDSQNNQESNEAERNEEIERLLAEEAQLLEQNMRLKQTASFLRLQKLNEDENQVKNRIKVSEGLNEKYFRLQMSLRQPKIRKNNPAFFEEKQVFSIDDNIE